MDLLITQPRDTREHSAINAADTAVGRQEKV